MNYYKVIELSGVYIAANSLCICWNFAMCLMSDNKDDQKLEDLLPEFNLKKALPYLQRK